jgi:hypothetical protein
MLPSAVSGFVIFEIMYKHQRETNHGINEKLTMVDDCKQISGCPTLLINTRTSFFPKMRLLIMETLHTTRET